MASASPMPPGAPKQAKLWKRLWVALILALLVQASEVMDDLYWQQSWPDKASLLAKAPDTYAAACVDLLSGAASEARGRIVDVV